MDILRPTAETWFDQGRDGQTNSHEDGTELERKVCSLLLLLLPMMMMMMTMMIAKYCASLLNIV
jgi:hypothetical protein